MKIDETELIEFFGVIPEKVDPEEKEFFGSTTFEVKRGDLALSVSFSSCDQSISLYLSSTKSGQKILHAKVGRILELRVRGKWLLIMIQNEDGRGPELKEVAAISLEPLKISIDAAEETKDD